MPPSAQRCSTRPSSPLLLVHPSFFTSLPPSLSAVPLPSVCILTPSHICWMFPSVLPHVPSSFHSLWLCLSSLLSHALDLKESVLSLSCCWFCVRVCARMFGAAGCQQAGADPWVYMQGQLHAGRHAGEEWCPCQCGAANSPDCTP